MFRELHARTQVLGVVATVVLVVAGWALVESTGGTPNAWAHMLYVPILLASLLWGLRGSVIVAVASGILLGPFTTHPQAVTDAAFTASWLNRLGFFVAIGVLAALGLRWARRRDHQFRAVVTHSADLVVLTDASGTIQFASPSTRTILGVEPEELMGKNARDIVHPDDDTAQVRDRRGLIRVRHADGSWRHLETIATDISKTDGMAGIVINARDVTEREALQAQITHLTYHDQATALPNRNLFLGRLDEELQKNQTTSLAVLLASIDHLDNVVGALGHDAHKFILAALAERLNRLVRHTDCIARVGDADLALYCLNLRDNSEIQELIDRLDTALREPITVGQETFRVAVSIGAAVAVRPEATAQLLLHQASTALRSARRHGTHTAIYHRDADDSSARSGVVAGLNQALVNNEFRVHYQPLVRVPTGDVVSVEALIRWEHPTAGLLSPAEFIPIAEDTGLIEPIGRWVLHEACRQLAQWRAQGHNLASLTVAVNVSAHQLFSPGFDATVQDALQSADLEASALTLEITESVMMENLDAATARLNSLKALGVNLAVDDFGTGYSSLGYLRTLPVDVIKIDRMFVHDLNRNDGASIVSAVIGLAHTFGMATVAEGVEDRDQLNVLSELGCDFVQGFYLARPLAADAIDEVLAKSSYLPPPEPAPAEPTPSSPNHSAWIRER